MSVNSAGLVLSETEWNAWTTEETTSTLSFEVVLYRNILKLKRRRQQLHSPKQWFPKVFMASLEICFKGPDFSSWLFFFFPYSFYRCLHSLFTERQTFWECLKLTLKDHRLFLKAVAHLKCQIKQDLTVFINLIYQLLIYFQQQYLGLPQATKFLEEQWTFGNRFYLSGPRKLKYKYHCQ